MSSIAFFPTANESLLEEAGVNADKFFFSYLAEGHYLPLEQKGKSTLKLEDPLELWNVIGDGLRIRRDISIEYPELLKGPNGIAPYGSKIGVCIIWRNTTLTQMGYIKSKRTTQNGIDHYSFIHDFKPGEISGDLLLETVFYLEEPSASVADDELALMNEAGVTLGEIDDVAIRFTSDDMEFPIVEVCDKSAPLWWLDLGQWEDPTVDPFTSEYVCLYLNTAYSYCPKGGSSSKGHELLVEIVSSAYLIIFQELINRNLIDKTIQNVDLEPGSIAKVMYYFASSCDPALRLENTAAMQKSIRTNIERMLKEGDEDEL